jgi:hypothetical protein
MTTLRPGQRLLTIPGHGLTVTQGRATLHAGAASWWLEGGVAAANAIVVYQPKGAASLAASYTNLANPGTYNAAPGKAPAFDTATGWGFTAASSQYLISSNFAIANNQTASVLVRFSDTAMTGRGFLFGFAGEFGIQPYFDGTDKLFRSRGASQKRYVPVATSGVVATAGLANYLDGSFLGNHSSIAAGSDMTTIAIGSQSATVPGNYLQGKIQAFAIYNVTLTAPQVAAVSAAMAAL